MVKAIKRYRVFVVKERIDRRGNEIMKDRPCLVISPDEMTRNLNMVTIAPFSSSTKDYPTRVEVIFQGKTQRVLLEQLQSVAKGDLKKYIGDLSEEDARKVAAKLLEIFAYD